MKYSPGKLLQRELYLVLSLSPISRGSGLLILFILLKASLREIPKNIFPIFCQLWPRFCVFCWFFKSIWPIQFILLWLTNWRTKPVADLRAATFAAKKWNLRNWFMIQHFFSKNSFWVKNKLGSLIASLVFGRPAQTHTHQKRRRSAHSLCVRPHACPNIVVHKSCNSFPAKPGSHSIIS